MKYFITGGSGFIGTNFIIKILNSSDVKILNYDLNTYAGSNDNLKIYANNKKYSQIKGDIADKAKLKKSIFDFKPNIVIHFAAESHVDRSIENPTNFINTNILGTYTLLGVVDKYLNDYSISNFKFIHVSTDEVYGSIKKGLFNENSPYRPNSPYSASKASSDHLVRAWQKTYGLPSIITNCSNNFGPFQFPEKLIPLIIINCIQEQVLPVYGSGKNIRDWLYVDDHCDAINKVIAKGQIGETYLIGGNNEIENIEIVKKICSIFDELKPRNNGESYEALIKYVEDRPEYY